MTQGILRCAKFVKNGQMEVPTNLAHQKPSLACLTWPRMMHAGAGSADDTWERVFYCVRYYTVRTCATNGIPP